jgi:hypothetical protein
LHPTYRTQNNRILSYDRLSFPRFSFFNGNFRTATPIAACIRYRATLARLLLTIDRGEPLSFPSHPPNSLSIPFPATNGGPLLRQLRALHKGAYLPPTKRDININPHDVSPACVLLVSGSLPDSSAGSRHAFQRTITDNNDANDRNRNSAEPAITTGEQQTRSMLAQSLILRNLYYNGGQ